MNLPTQQTVAVTLRQKIERMMPEFRRALPAHIPPEKFVRTLQTAVQMNPQVAQAAQATEGGMQSFFAACTKAAQDGLVLDGREATLVTFRQKASRRGEPDRYEDRVQYIPMVAGLMKKARNSGEISSISAHVVYQKDHFVYELGDDERIEHKPHMGEDRGEPIAVYAIVRLKDGGIQREVMDRGAIMAIAAQSKNKWQYDPKEGANYAEWWRKTVIRRISKYLPSSSDRDEFMQAVQRIDEEFDFDAADSSEATHPEPKPQRKKRGAAAAALKDVTPKTEIEDAEVIEHDPETGEVLETDEQQPGDDI